MVTAVDGVYWIYILGLTAVLMALVPPTMKPLMFIMIVWLALWLWVGLIGVSIFLF